MLKTKLRSGLLTLIALAMIGALSIQGVVATGNKAYGESSYSSYWGGTYDWSGYALWEDCDWDGFDDHTGKKVPVGFDGTRGDNPSGPGANSQVANKNKTEDTNFLPSTGADSSTTDKATTTKPTTTKPKATTKSKETEKSTTSKKTSASASKTDTADKVAADEQAAETKTAKSTDPAAAEQVTEIVDVATPQADAAGAGIESRRGAGAVSERWFCPD
jgi:hypothetical protein